MKKITVVSFEESKAKHLDLDRFIVNNLEDNKRKKVSKKMLKKLAKKLDLTYSKAQIDFTHKIMSAYKEMA